MQRNWTEYLAKLKTLESLKRVTGLLEKSPLGIELINVQIIPVQTGICGVKNYKILALSDGKLSQGLARTFKDNPSVEMLKFMCELGGKSILSKITVVDGENEVEVILTWVLESSITYREFYLSVWEVISQMKVFGEPEIIYFGLELKDISTRPAYLGQFNRKLLKDKSNVISKWDHDLCTRLIEGENWFNTFYGKGVSRGKFLVECLSQIKNWNCLIDAQTTVIGIKAVVLNEHCVNNMMRKHHFSRFQHPLVPRWIPFQTAVIVDENNVGFKMDINWELYEPALKALELMSNISKQNNVMSLIQG